jgi:hypothetical protein
MLRAPTTHPNDPVPDLPPVDPVEWFNGSSAHFGTDPASPEFGGKDFYVDPGKLATPWNLIGAHSQYWDRNSASLKNEETWPPTP